MTDNDSNCAFHNEKLGNKVCVRSHIVWQCEHSMCVHKLWKADKQTPSLSKLAEVAIGMMHDLCRCGCHAAQTAARNAQLPTAGSAYTSRAAYMLDDRVADCLLLTWGSSRGPPLMQTSGRTLCMYEMAAFRLLSYGSSSSACSLLTNSFSPVDSHGHTDAHVLRHARSCRGA